MTEPTPAEILRAAAETLRRAAEFADHPWGPPTTERFGALLDLARAIGGPILAPASPPRGPQDAPTPDGAGPEPEHSGSGAQTGAQRVERALRAQLLRTSLTLTEELAARLDQEERAERAEAQVRRVRQMAHAWRHQLPNVIRRDTAADALLLTTEQYAHLNTTKEHTEMTTLPRRFHIERDIDITGVSGTGHVADGIRWADGSASVRFLGDRPSIVFWASMDDAVWVHTHAGGTDTRIVWDEPEPIGWDNADTACPHCPDGHTPPEHGQPWGAYVGPERDGDGQPTTIHVARTSGAHVAESDAEWIRQRLNYTR